MKIVVSGATGFIGKRVVVELARRGHHVVALTRNAALASSLPCEALEWKAERAGADESLTRALAGAEAIVNLAGHPVAESRWTEKTKGEIRDSRVLGTRRLVEGIAKLSPSARPKMVISASAIGFYGERGDETLTEDSAPGKGFLSDVVVAWEAETLRAEELGLRSFRLRFGIVLGHDGGALSKMQPVTLGSGKQWMSWIHVDDVVGFILFALEHPERSGVYNLTAPNAVSNAEFTHAFGLATGQAVRLAVPKFALKAALGEMSEVLLQSQHVLPRATQAVGFQFAYPTLVVALRAIFPTASPLEKRFSSVQYVPQPIEKVFEYFSAAENLEALTPPWLGFHIVRKSSAEVRENTLIDYKLRIHGVPVRWQSRIESWSPNQGFVDTQTRGPYQKWHHTHRFEALPGGTLVSDDVIYRVPGGRLGNLVGGIPVRKDIEKIFAYRRKKISEVFSR